jgi:hypothetical protein
MICYWRRFTWIVSGLRLPRQRFTPTLRPPWASQRLPCHLARPMAETTASVATKTSITTKNCTSGNGGGNNSKNSNGSRGRGGSSGQTTAPTGSDGRTNAPRPTYDHPWQGHVTMYPARARWTAGSAGLRGHTGPLRISQLLSGPQQQLLLYQQVTPAPGWNPWLGASWDQQSLTNSFSTMALHPAP